MCSSAESYCTLLGKKKLSFALLPFSDWTEPPTQLLPSAVIKFFNFFCMWEEFFSISEKWVYQDASCWFKEKPAEICRPLFEHSSWCDPFSLRLAPSPCTCPAGIERSGVSWSADPLLRLASHSTAVYRPVNCCLQESPNVLNCIGKLGGHLEGLIHTARTGDLKL